MDKIRTIIDKEWAELFKNRIVLFTVAFLPLLFTALPLIMLYALGSELGSDASDLPPQFFEMCGAELSGGECFQVYLVYEFLLLFMMMPLAIPVAISAYSIVGEKTTRCLEPLLATPITTVELIVGKGLAAGIPAVLATWAGFAVFAVGARLLVSNPLVYARLLDPMWLVAVGIVGPLMAVSAITVSIIVSSHVSDPRVAEQVSMVVILPLLGVFFAQVAGVMLIDMRFVLAAAALLAALDAGLVYLTVKLFQRETILTKWR
ncbi:MAG: ABC transporter permease subunit [Thermoflexales bacterium]|nr:ABC transporter permease subunit [Thermoflexales bacterium]